MFGASVGVLWFENWRYKSAHLEIVSIDWVFLLIEYIFDVIKCLFELVECNYAYLSVLKVTWVEEDMIWSCLVQLCISKGIEVIWVEDDLILVG